MKYLKRLKNELQDLTEKLSPPKKGDLPEYVNLRDVDRKGVLKVVIALIQIARSLDQSSDTWGPKMSHEWCTFVANLEHWCKLVHETPSVSEKKNPTPTAVAAKKAPEPVTNLNCMVSHTSQGSFEVLFLNLSQQELQSVRNALVIHSAYTQEAKEVLAGMLDALRIAGINTGDASYPVMPWEEKEKKPEVEKPKAEA